MPGYNIIVIGASAGGVEALKQLTKQLSATLSAAVFVVLHIPSSGKSVMPSILTRSGHLPALHPEDGEQIRPGQIYVAPPNHHLLVQRDRIRLSLGPRENGHRPAIDTLFRSAAQTGRQRVIGIVLSGTLDDGTAGLAIIKAKGGMAIVQDPEEALFDGMPRNAINAVAVDHVLKLAEIAALLNNLTDNFTNQVPTSLTNQLANQSANDPTNSPLPNHLPEHDPLDDVLEYSALDNSLDGSPEDHDPMTENDLEQEATIVAKDKAVLERGEQTGNTSPLTCPDCGGVLWELGNDNLLRFRCHTGHAYSSNSLLVEQSNDVERALWSATRALEERASLSRRMAVSAQKQHRSISEALFNQQAREAEQHAALVRQVIMQQSQNKSQNLEKYQDEE